MPSHRQDGPATPAPPRRTGLRSAALALGLAVLLPSCGGHPLPDPPPVVDVILGDFSISHRVRVPEGRVVFRARNAGQADHELVLVGLPPSFTLSIDAQLRSDTRRAFPTKGYLPRRPAGSRGTFAADLEPGRYGFVCFVSDPDGKTHALKGMSSEFTVE